MRFSTPILPVALVASILFFCPTTAQAQIIYLVEGTGAAFTASGEAGDFDGFHSYIQPVPPIPQSYPYNANCTAASAYLFEAYARGTIAQYSSDFANQTQLAYQMAYYGYYQLYIAKTAGFIFNPPGAISFDQTYNDAYKAYSFLYLAFSVLQ